MKNKGRTLAAPLLVAVALLVAPRAEAATIRISDGVTTVDVDATIPGLVVELGGIGDWTFFLGGTTKPFEGSATDPSMSLGFLASSTSDCVSPCTLTVLFSETDFGPSGPSSLTAASAFLPLEGSSSSTYQTYQGSANGLFELTNLITSGVGSSVETGSLPLQLAPYSLTQRITLTHTGAGLSLVSGVVQPGPQATVPDGGSALAMLGTVLLGVGVLRRRLARRL